MQTFLPFPDFKESAHALDPVRLNTQISECRHILRSLKGLSRAHRQHPTTRMWEGYEKALSTYAIECCNVYTSCVRPKVHQYAEELAGYEGDPDRKNLPWWFGSLEFHASHQRRLLWEEPRWYLRFINVHALNFKPIGSEFRFEKPMPVWPLSNGHWGWDGEDIWIRRVGRVERVDIQSDKPMKVEGRNMLVPTRIGENDACWLVQDFPERRKNAESVWPIS